MATCRSVKLKHSSLFFIGIRKLSEIPCRVSSDLHEWHNELTTVSKRDSVKLQDP